MQTRFVYFDLCSSIPRKTSDKLQFVVFSRKGLLAEVIDKLKFVGHRTRLSQKRAYCRLGVEELQFDRKLLVLLSTFILK